MIHFQYPALLLLLVPLALLGFWLARRGSPGAVAHSSAELLRSVARVRRTRFGRFLPALRWLGAALLVVALARPFLAHQTAQVHASGVDVMLAVDVSGSMQARDMAVAGSKEPLSRLEAAKLVVSRFVQDRSNDRVGLVAFAGEPYLASPLTLDHDWVLQNLERLESNKLRDGTAIGSAIATAARRLGRGAGLDLAGVVLTIGQEHQDLRLRALRVDVDEAGLKKVADVTGGKFYRATDTDSLGHVYGEIDRLEKTTRTLRSFTEKSERFTWLAAPGLFLLLGHLVLSATRFRRVP
jgi:Ca-activated chloride channel family protein